MRAAALQLLALPGMPLVRPGDDLAALILAALERAGLSLVEGDVLAVSSKIVSRAEGRFVDLSTVTPGAEARQRAALTGKDARLVELVLRESQAISRQAPDVLVSVHRLGFISANAGIDHSNAGGDDLVLLLPCDPDASAGRLRASLAGAGGSAPGVVIMDSHGRPFRLGTVGVAIGVAGLPALLDLRGQRDLHGRELRVSMQGHADMVASAAQLAGGEGDEGRPVVLLRGLQHPGQDGRAGDLLRPAGQDLYR
ncbi:MAG: coenzyme F420-0:L-glutamate ligase [Anaerolineaceae bacterium]|nr:coenzyme F420-0:L-glutamate ligase [Anaerolineaceae bacterium]